MNDIHKVIDLHSVKREVENIGWQFKYTVSEPDPQVFEHVITIRTQPPPLGISVKEEVAVKDKVR